MEVADPAETVNAPVNPEQDELKPSPTARI
jgi:hypothetical protein